MSKKALVVGIIAVLILVAGGILYLRSFDQSFAPVEEMNVEGIVKYATPDARILTLTSNDGKTLTLVLTENAALKDKNGGTINVTDFAPGQDVSATGKAVSDNSYLVSAVTVRSEISSSPNPGSSEIQITSPLQNAAVASPLEVTGKAKGGWYFEASFPVRLVDANNKELASAPAQAQGDWMTTDFVPFKATLTFSKPATQTGFLIFENDNPSGDPARQKRVTIPVQFNLNASTTNISLFYPDTSKVKNPGDECSPTIVSPVTRQVAVSETPIRSAINLLISGDLTSEEKEKGFQTEFPNSDFKLVGASQKSGTLTLEFTEVPGFTSGGSCRVALLAAQITKTVKQFPGVNTVIFKPDSIFQP